jgi:hypothetical protein
MEMRRHTLRGLSDVLQGDEHGARCYPTAMARAARKRRKLALRFPAREIPDWASRFPGSGSDRVLDSIRARVVKRGCLTRAEFLTLCEWKSPRSRPRCLENSESAVRAVTRAALASLDEEVKVELLRVLRGVEWATASTILHACDARPYPILDVRALWSLGYTGAHVTLDLWLEYVACTRSLAARLGLGMRTLDRALWQYSKERQR